MVLTDYYQILELTPSATQAEIKKAYRRLAQQYHPDKTNNEPFAVARFSAIKEAYEILTHPAKKDYYLQHRWYEESIGGKKKQGIVTPVTLLKQVLELDRYVSTLDAHRMDKEGLIAYLVTILNDENIEILNTTNDPDINREITSAILHCSMLLPLHFVGVLYKRLLRLNNDAVTTEKIGEWYLIHQKDHRMEKYRIWLLVLIVAILCLLMYFISS